MLHMTIVSTLCTLICLFHLAASAALASNRCRCFPGDACWPSSADWARLNSSVDGRLVATVPLARPCHDPYYNAAKCKALEANWIEPSEHFDSSSSVTAPFFSNQSCDPFTSRSTPCTLGNYVNYAINVTEKSDVAKGIAFATKHNIRLVIRNTGHDYNGKSTGAGALGIWTHYLKGIKFFDYKDGHYTGKAYKIGAGVQGIEVYEAGNKVGLTIVSGECATVGVAGGYTQGGGHSALASKYGLAADQTLAWEVITGTGEFLTATRTNNSDLYWALSGGGGGTYGIVWSLTAKAHFDNPVSAANLSWTSEGVTQDTFFRSVAAYHAWTPTVVDAGAMTLGFGTNTTFSVGPITAPGIPVAKLEALLQPLLDQLQRLGIKYTAPVLKQFPGYLEEFNTMMPPIPVGTSQYGGWWLPRSVVLGNPDGVAAAYKNITNGGAASFASVALNVSKTVAGDVYNAVHPGWRETLLDVIITTNWNFTAPISDMLAQQEAMTTRYIPALKAIAPRSGAYLNEGDFRDPDWKKAFYGANYPKLRAIKAKYDPNDIFYATTAVGSDDWVIEAPGKLCKVGTASARRF